MIPRADGLEKPTKAVRDALDLAPLHGGAGLALALAAIERLCDLLDELLAPEPLLTPLERDAALEAAGLAEDKEPAAACRHAGTRCTISVLVHGVMRELSPAVSFHRAERIDVCPYCGSIFAPWEGGGVLFVPERR